MKKRLIHYKDELVSLNATHSYEQMATYMVDTHAWNASPEAIQEFFKREGIKKVPVLRGGVTCHGERSEKQRETIQHVSMANRKIRSCMAEVHCRIVG